MSLTVDLIVIGGLGRLGRSILTAAAGDSDVRIIAAVVRPGTRSREGSTTPLLESLDDVPLQKAVYIDAARGETVGTHVRWARKRGNPYLLASSGYDSGAKEEVMAAAKEIPILVAPNLSRGIALMKKMISDVTPLWPGSSIEIVETHHAAKKDKPSATALDIGETITRAGKEVTPPIHSLRGGDVVGEHRVFFYADGEMLEIRHTATSRSVFGFGAVAAAKFLIRQRPGLYRMEDVLEMKGKPNEI